MVSEVLLRSEVGYDTDTLKSTRSWYDDGRTLKTFGIWSLEKHYIIRLILHRIYIVSTCFTFDFLSTSKNTWNLEISPLVFLCVVKLTFFLVLGVEYVTKFGQLESHILQDSKIDSGIVRWPGKEQSELTLPNNLFLF